MTPIELRDRIADLIHRNQLAEAEALLADHVEEMPTDQQTVPFSAPLRLRNSPREVLTEAAIAVPLVSDLARMIRNARYRTAVGEGRLRIVEEGDSWHLYPVKLRDIIDVVADTHPVLSLSNPGDTAERMATDDEVTAVLMREKPHFFLLSAGGNDLLGEAGLATVIRPHQQGMTAADLIDTSALQGQVAQVAGHIGTMIRRALAAAPRVHVLLHGYDYPVPVANGHWLGGPLAARGISLPLGARVLRRIVDEFYLALATLAAQHPGQVHLVDYRGIVGSAKGSWKDELHPHNAGFKRLAETLLARIDELRTQESTPARKIFETAITGGKAMPLAVRPDAAVRRVPAERVGAGSGKGTGKTSQPDTGDDDDDEDNDDLTGTLMFDLIREKAQRLPEIRARARLEAIQDSKVARQAWRDIKRLRAEIDTAELTERVKTRNDYSIFQSGSLYERIIGQEDIDHYFMLARGMAAGRAVARLMVRGGNGSFGHAYGTGFLVAPGLLLTNHHLLPTRELAADSILLFDYQLNDDGIPVPHARFALDPVLFLTDEHLDFTFVGVKPLSAEGRPLSDWGHLPLLERSGKVLKKEFVNIIQHPGAGYKRVALRENMVVGRKGDFLYYVTDTEEGSSGSPVMNEEWQVAALHHMSVVNPRKPDIFVANRGVRISSILTHIATLRDEGSAMAARIDALVTAARNAAPPSPIATPPAAPPPEAVAVTGPAMTTAGAPAGQTEAAPAPTLRQRPPRTPPLLTAPADARPDQPDDDTLERRDRAAPDVRPAPGQTESAGQTEAPAAAVAFWPRNSRNAPDTWHLPPETAASPFTLTADLVDRIIATSQFRPDTAPHDRLILSLRGCALEDGSTMAENRDRVALRPVPPDHRSFRCLIGVYDLSTRRISLYLGSTVPLEKHMRSFMAGGSPTNLLPTGCYLHCVGGHFSGSTGKETSFVLRMGSTPVPDARTGRATVLRTKNDLCYGTLDLWDDTTPNDNIHPAFASGAGGFSSQGCLTVRGTQTPGGRFDTGTGEWRAFRKAAGFDGTGRGMLYHNLLVTGHEAASLALASDPAPLACLRHGSFGAPVRRLQTQLGLRDSGDFDAPTRKALAARQMTELGFATGSWSPAMAALLQMEF